ncbi:MAG: hypothetical protein NTX64_14335 [Elusimicrobia bacterium]|nr:hypothetical protein [Elusimicrobiota bacterium]
MKALNVGREFCGTLAITLHLREQDVDRSLGVGAGVVSALKGLAAIELHRGPQAPRLHPMEDQHRVHGPPAG